MAGYVEAGGWRCGNGSEAAASVGAGADEEGADATGRLVESAAEAGSPLGGRAAAAAAAAAVEEAAAAAFESDVSFAAGSGWAGGAAAAAVGADVAGVGGWRWCASWALRWAISASASALNLL